MNIRVPTRIYDILYCDARYFGFAKGKRVNLSGFLNHIIPLLSNYQDDLHQQLLKYNGGNAEITRAIEQNIHNVYLDSFDFHDDTMSNIPFRISYKYYDEFINIHDSKLEYYDSNFTSFIRNLLIEYATKKIEHREWFYAYGFIETLKQAINNSDLCYFYTKEDKCSFVPVAIEVSPHTSHTFVVGFGFDKNGEKNFRCIMLSSLKNVINRHKKYNIGNYECELLYDGLQEVFEEEYIDYINFERFFSGCLD